MLAAVTIVGDGYALLPIDIAIDAGEIKQERCEAQRQQGQHQAEGDKKLLTD